MALQHIKQLRAIYDLYTVSHKKLYTFVFVIDVKNVPEKIKNVKKT